MSVQVSPDVGLVQSSTIADQIAFKFEQGQEGMVAGSYLEFAQRAVLPQFKHLPVSYLLLNFLIVDDFAPKVMSVMQGCELWFVWVL